MSKFFKKHFLFIILFLLLASLFSWHEWENFSFTKKINDVKITNFFVSLAAISTIASVLILYQDYYSKILERQPLIMIESLSLFTQDIEPTVHNNLRIREFYSDYTKKEKVWSPSLTLKNIGFGAALSINIFWEYDENEIKNFIQDYYNPFGQPIKTDAILFIGKDGSEKIKIPGYFLTTLGYSLHDDVRASDGGNLSKRPDLVLIVVYKDIFNKVHQKKFSFDVSAHSGIILIKPISIT